MVGKSTDAAAELAKADAELRTALTDLERVLALGVGPVRLGEDGELIIPPLTAEDIPAEAEVLKAELTELLPFAPIVSLLIELDRRTGFLDCFTHAGGKQARTPELRWDASFLKSRKCRALRTLSVGGTVSAWSHRPRMRCAMCFVVPTATIPRPRSLVWPAWQWTACPMTWPVVSLVCGRTPAPGWSTSAGGTSHTATHRPRAGAWSSPARCTMVRTKSSARLGRPTGSRASVSRARSRVAHGN